MTTKTSENQSIERELAIIRCYLRDIRQDMSTMLRTVQDELESFREREFWRDYGQTYQEE